MSEIDIEALRLQARERMQAPVTAHHWLDGVHAHLVKTRDMLALLDELERLRAQEAVRGGDWCKENRVAGRNPCGACALCVRDLRYEGARLRAAVEEARRWLSVQHDAIADHPHMHTLARHEHTCTMDRIAIVSGALAEVEQILDAYNSDLGWTIAAKARHLADKYEIRGDELSKARARAARLEEALRELVEITYSADGAGLEAALHAAEDLFKGGIGCGCGWCDLVKAEVNPG